MGSPTDKSLCEAFKLTGQWICSQGGPAELVDQQCGTDRLGESCATLSLVPLGNRETTVIVTVHLMQCLHTHTHTLSQYQQKAGNRQKTAGRLALRGCSRTKPLEG